MRPTSSRLWRAALLVAAAASLNACGTRDTPPSGVTRADLFTPVASVDEIMEALVIPSSQAVFDAVVYVNGAVERAPTSDQDWQTLKLHALAVAEAGNLLLMAPRVKEADDWRAAANAMTRAGAAASDAAKSKDLDGLLKAGSDLYSSCTACHRTYLPAGP
jgi:cytochrome c556